MIRNTLLKIVNPVLAVLALNQILTGVLRDTLPRALFAPVHEAGGLAFAVAALLHVILNWTWIKSNFLKKAVSTPV